MGVAKSADKTFTKHLASSALRVGFMEKEAPDRGNLTLDTMWDEVLSYARQERAFQDFLKKREIELEEERQILEEIKTLPCTDARDLVEFEGLDLEISCTLPTRAEADIPKELEVARE